MSTPALTLPSFRGPFAAAFALALASVSSAEVLYTENFDNPAKADRSFNGIKWEVANAASVDQPLNVPPPDIVNRYGVLNGNPGTGAGKPGYIWTSLSEHNLRVLRGPIKLTPAATVAELEKATISFDVVASAGSSAVYFLIQLDNADWYLSATESVPAVVGQKKGFDAVAKPGAATQRVTFSAAASAWQKLALVAEQPIGFEPLSASLSAKSEVTGIGFLIRNNKTGVTLRLDTVVIDTAKPGA